MERGDGIEREYVYVARSRDGLGLLHTGTVKATSDNEAFQNAADDIQGEGRFKLRVVALDNMETRMLTKMTTLEFD